MSDDNPFEALGLPIRRDLTDEEVRGAWRVIAAQTHPDLPDGGDPARFAVAAAAYADLRTAFGRTEAYADLTVARPRHVAAPSRDPVARPRDPAARPRHVAARPRDPAASAATSFAPAPEATLFAHAPFRVASSPLAGLVWRLRHGRPGVLAVRLAIAAGAVAGSAAIAGWQPATLAIAVGVLTWLARTTRYDLAPY